MTDIQKSSHRAIGDIGEDIAVRYIEEKHLTIIERNYQIQWGEIDIIAKDGDFFVFVEVKYRKDESFWHPLDTFTPMKRRAFRRTVMHYLMKNKINPEMIRVDFIGIMPKLSGEGHRVWWMRGVEV